MRGTAAKLLGVGAGVAIVGILVGFYVSGWAVGNTTPYRQATTAGTIDGFGGPMQSVGYMDGFLNVV
jgi:hypothetical protein